MCANTHTHTHHQTKWEDLLFIYMNGLLYRLYFVFILIYIYVADE